MSWLNKVSAVMLVFTAQASADDTASKTAKNTKVQMGTFRKLAGEFELRFSFLKDNKLRFSMKNNFDEGMQFEARYKQSEDGTINMTVIKAKKIGEFPSVPMRGAKYSIKPEFIGKDKVKITELKGTNAAEAAELVEGEYKRFEEK